MLIVCPSCSSRYELDAAKLGPAGRKVRCASCQTEWHVDPTQIFPEAPPPEETQALLNEELENANAGEAAGTAETDQQEADEPTTPLADQPSQPAQRGKRNASRAKSSRGGSPRSRRTAVIAGLGLSGAALLAMMIWQRAPVVRAAPQLAIVFDKLGLPVNARGLSLTSVESGLIDDGQGRFLIVEGDVTNITGANRPMPPIEVAVRDAAGQTLYTWTTDPPRSALEPAELVHFRARLAAPPESGKTVQVRFAATKTAGLAPAH